MNLQRLLHNRVELMLVFVVPIAFFSVFAMIFVGGLGSGSTPKVKVIAVDEVGTETSQEVLQSLRDGGSLRFMRDEDPRELKRTDAEDIVRRGGATMAIVLSEQDGEVAATLLADVSDQVAGQVVSALVTRALIVTQSKNARPPNIPADPSATSDSKIEQVDYATGSATAASDAQPEQNAPALTEVEIVDIIGSGKSNPVVSMYAAGIAVMFLLFGATGGGGALLEERESQTLDRLLSTRLTMDQLLLGKWFYQTMVGVLQVTIMFAWGQLVFGVDLLGNLDGFFIMTIVTAAAAAAFGLFLATLCKTRGQLNGLSVILILTMSALGGSMVPRYVMSEKMREAGLWTFNAWALDGYDKIFWRDLPVRSLEPQLIVLMATAFGFLLVSRILAIRWECD